MGDKRDLLMGMAAVWLVAGFIVRRRFARARRAAADCRGARSTVDTDRAKYNAARKNAYKERFRALLGLLVVVAIIAATIYGSTNFPD